MQIKRLRGDLAIVRVIGPASKVRSTLIICPDSMHQTGSRTHVYWAELVMAGDGIRPLDGGPPLPGLLECPGMALGATVLCLQRFAHEAAKPALQEGEILINDLDVIGFLDECGQLKPCWGYCLIDCPRQSNVARPAFEGSKILLVDGERHFNERPIATGSVLQIGLDLHYKTEAEDDPNRVGARVKSYFGASKPGFKPGDRVVFRRFASWRVFPNAESRDDNLMLVPQRDVLSRIDAKAEFVCVDNPNGAIL